MYKILSESTEFCGRYNKNVFVCFFSVQTVDVMPKFKNISRDLVHLPT